MIEILAEFDLNDYGYVNGYFFGENVEECAEKVKEELEMWGGGHADMFDEDGEFIDDVEV